MVNKKIVIAECFIFLVFFFGGLALEIRNSGNIKATSNVYSACDITAPIGGGKSDGLMICIPLAASEISDESEMLTQFFPDGTLVHITGVYLDGHIDVDHVDAEIDESIIAYCEDNGVLEYEFPDEGGQDTIKTGIESYLFRNRINVLDVDSPELSEIYVTLYSEHNGFDTRLIVGVVASVIVFLSSNVLLWIKTGKQEKVAFWISSIPVIVFVLSIALFKRILIGL